MHLETLKFLLGGGANATNTHDPFSLSALSNCDSRLQLKYVDERGRCQLLDCGCFTYIDKAGHVWGFDTKNIIMHLSSNKSNPFTRQKIPSKDIYRAMCLKHYIDKGDSYMIVSLSSVDILVEMSRLMYSTFKFEFGEKCQRVVASLSLKYTLMVFMACHVGVDTDEFFDLYILDAAILHRNGGAYSTCPVKTTLVCEIIRIIKSHHPRKLCFIQTVIDILMDYIGFRA